MRETTPTPRTDAMMLVECPQGTAEAYLNARDLCRQLERELADANAERDEAHRDMRSLALALGAAADGLGEMSGSGAAVLAMARAQAVVAERDAARAALAEAADVAEFMVAWTEIHATQECVARWNGRADRWRRAAGNAHGNDAKGVKA